MMKLAEKIYLILCEDIRQEKGNKFSLIGVYTDRIIFSEIPSLMPQLSFCIRLEKIKSELPSGEIRLISPQTKPTNFNFGSPPNQTMGSTINFFISLSPYRVEAPGRVRIELHFEGFKKPSLVYKFQIEQKTKPKTDNR